MENIIRSQSYVYHLKKQYQKPEIVQELLLETKAGTPIDTTPVPPPGENNNFVPPGDFSINTEP